MSIDDAALPVPAQSIPAPQSLSPQARAYLNTAARKFSESEASNSADAVRELVSSEAAAIQFIRPLAMHFKGSFESIALPSGAMLYRAIPEGRKGRAAEVAYFDVHGGGFLVGGGEMCQL